MTKFLANCFLIVAGISLQLGNYWYTFGLWPQNWWTFFGFAFATVLLMALRVAQD